MKFATRDFSILVGIFSICVRRPCYTITMTKEHTLLQIAVPKFPFDCDTTNWESTFRSSLKELTDFEGEVVKDWSMLAPDSEDETFAPCVLSHYAFIFGQLPPQETALDVIVGHLLAVTDEDFIERSRTGTVPLVRDYKTTIEE